MRQSFEGIKARVVSLGGQPGQFLQRNIIRKCVPCGAMSSPDGSTRMAGDSYSRRFDFINMFFRTQTRVIGFAITSLLDMAS
jgi:hypothetical protein